MQRRDASRYFNYRLCLILRGDRKSRHGQLSQRDVFTHRVAPSCAHISDYSEGCHSFPLEFPRGTDANDSGRRLQPSSGLHASRRW
jgi:hypothetical protein